MGLRISLNLNSRFGVPRDDITSIMICGERVARVIPPASEHVSQQPPASGSGSGAGSIKHDENVGGTTSRCQLDPEKVRVVAQFAFGDLFDRCDYSVNTQQSEHTRACL